MSDALETLKVILRKKLSASQFQELMEELAIALSQGAVSISSAPQDESTVILNGNQNVVGSNNYVVIKQGLDAEELVNVLHIFLREMQVDVAPSDVLPKLTEPLVIQPKSLFEDTDRPIIGILGLGFSGTVTAIRMLELATQPLNLLVIHSDQDSKYGGIAYGDSNCGWEHLLNIQAGRISLFRERPTDFLDWVNIESTIQRSEWPHEWKNHEFRASSAVPRRIYGQYLASRFKKAQEGAKKLVSAIEISAVVEAIQERVNRVEISLRDHDQKSTYVCDRVVITTGHDSPLVPECLQKLGSHEQIFKTPYSRKFSERVTELSSEQSVMIIGTGLSSYDAVLTLQHHDFKGQIFMVSRNGFIHKPYPGNHIHDIISLPLPTLPDEQLSAEKMYNLLEAEIVRGRDFLKATQVDIDNQVIEERVLKALEPWTAQWIQRSDAHQVQKFLDIAKSRLTTSRTGIVPEVNSVIWRLKHQELRLQLIAGDIQRIDETPYGFTVKIKKVEEDREYDIETSVIVSCLGYNADFSCTTNQMWKMLLEQGSAMVHPKTRRGIAVGEYGEMVRRDGSVSQRVFAVGPMRQGDEIERRGRLGAFVFSVGTIRNQALLTAVRMLWLTENSDYAAMDTHTRREVDEACESIFTDSANIGQSKHLVNTILAVRLSNVISYLRPEDKIASGAVDKWLDKHLQETIKGIAEPSNVNKEVIQHVVWYQAHLRAALIATDISRLAHDHYRVGRYSTETATEFLNERLSCSSILRASVAVFGASTGSMLIYSPDDKKLYPFAMYRRVESFTPTAYGEGVAGALVKAFEEGEQSTNLDARLIFREGGQVIGAFVPNYNQLQTDLKKGVYIRNERRFPSVLVSLLVANNQVLGIVYVEAEKHRSFDLQDAKLLAAMMAHKFEVIKKAQGNWDRRSIPSYRFGDFEGADLHRAPLSKQNLSQAIFKKADLFKANLYHADLTGASFDFADLREANMKSATIFRASFIQANMARCIFDGADIKYCTFDRSDLTDCHLAGTVLENCTFEDANLTGTEFRDLDVSSINFTNAVMRKCGLKKLRGVERAIWSGVDLTGCVVDEAVWNALPDFIKIVHAGLVSIRNQT